MHSNINMVEVVTKFEQYVEKAIEFGLPTIICTNHGVLTGWYNRKKLLESKNMKYVHAVEGYVTWNLEEKVRDNFHLSLFAKNFKGFKELNKIVSKSFNRDDNHYYYNPRISWEEVKGTSDNIIISTACLGGLMWRLRKDNERSKDIINWIINNKHRVFLEVQPHLYKDQIELNKYLLKLAEDNDLMIIAGGDVHALNEDHDKARKILQKSKKVVFSNEDSFDLTLKSYDELYKQFKEQGALTDSQIETALENTNVLLSMIEPFELDYSKKYPKLYENAGVVLKEKIKEGIYFRGIDKFPKDKRKVYLDRIKYELETYKKNEAEDYLLLEDMVKKYARDNDIPYGYGRGSVSGSIVAYLMRITEMDSVEHDLNFERFMSKERISLADVDSDYSPSKRHLIQKFLIDHPKLYCAPIMTANTIALKGAIRDIGRGLEMSLSDVDDIAKNIEEREKKYRDKYHELFKYVDIVQGVITSIGQHACGICVSPIPLDENMGLITTSDSEYPLTMLNMKEIDAQNYVKLDILGLDTTEIISETAKLAVIPFPTPQTLNQNDENVWESILESNVGIFQWESDFSHQVYKDLFSKQTIGNIKKRNPDFSYIDLFSLGNAILRPSGASYRDSVIKGEFYDNGHEALNEFLAPTLGRLVYQEQQLGFLVKFCGYTGGQADLVRRGIGKKSKEIIDNELPKIEKTFIEKMISEYELSHDEAESIAKPFLQVFLDSANYGFSVNHSEAYSWMGYACAWLRYYYPIEFITASLNINIGKEEKTAKLIEYAKLRGISVNPIKFRYSKSGYSFDKNSNSIYQGIKPIKFLNSQAADDLYKLKDNNYKTFTDLLIDISKKTHVNYKQLKILTQLNFFQEFGKNNKLLLVIDMYEKKLKNSKLKEDTKQKRKIEVEEYEKTLDDKSIGLKDQIKAEVEYYGYEVTTLNKLPKGVYSLTDIDTKYTPRLRLYHLKDGSILELKCKKSIMEQNKLEKFNIIKVNSIIKQNKKKLIDGRWVEIDEKELFLVSWDILK
jgi:DNA polymerase-3 subunit alpha